MIDKMTLRRRVLPAVAGVLAAATAACSGPSGPAHHADRTVPRTAGATLSAFLAAATDLGPSRRANVATLVTLRTAQRPTTLLRWAAHRSLRVDWRPGDAWAGITGPSPKMQSAFGVQIHDYRTRAGQRFYASPQQLHIPSAVRTDVRATGQILSYLPTPSQPPTAVTTGGFHADVPAKGLTPDELLTAYRAKSLADQGYTGKGQTVVFYEWDGWKQSDMDAYARLTGLPQFTPALFNGSFSKTDDETPMDIEVVHAIVPDAKIVVVNAMAYLQKYQNVGLGFSHMFQDVATKYPGSVWSLSISYACEKALRPAEVNAIDQALAAAETNQSVTAFQASGDTGSLECKAFRNGGYAAPPDQSDVGLLGPGDLPHMTMVGGTLLSTDAQGDWFAEEAWTSTTLSQGTSGGTSVIFQRPAWQAAPGLAAQRGSNMRLSPDVAADADPRSGVRLVLDGQETQGGGTSQAAPIWAGLTTIMNAYLKAHGGKELGDINPLLYRAAKIDPSAFHDITLGASAVDNAAPGYDLTTGLGTPDVEKLVIALQTAQKGQS